MEDIIFSVFTKPWPDKSILELGEFVSNLGFNAIEFPLRPGFQVEPEEAESKLPELVNKLKKFNIQVASVASGVEEKVFAGCAEAGIPIIRIMARYDRKRDYLEWESDKKRELEKLIPLCEKYGVKIGIQNHCGAFASNSMELRHLIESFDSKYIGAVWDAGHCGLTGEAPEQGLDIVWSHLCMVNLKNAYYKRNCGPELKEITWDWYFTTGGQGLASWPRTVEYLKEKKYQGVICLTAEYSAENEVDNLIEQDIKYAKSLFEKN